MSFSSLARMAAILSFLTAPCTILAADEPWPEDEFERTRRVSGGELRFLASPPDTQVHHHHNRITITAQSLRDGWVSVEQCHDGLDAVPRSEVVFSPERSRKLRIVNSEHIGRAWVDGASVQLTDVAAGARLCLALQSRALQAEGDGRYRLRNGPYMRQFLDGYYPLHVTMEVAHPADLSLVSAMPAPQPGLTLDSGAGWLRLEAWFDGRLTTELVFHATH